MQESIWPVLVLFARHVSEGWCAGRLAEQGFSPPHRFSLKHAFPERQVRNHEGTSKESFAVLMTCEEILFIVFAPAVPVFLFTAGSGLYAWTPRPICCVLCFDDVV